MAARPSWEGHLRLSLVTCLVALYPATIVAESIRMRTVGAGTGEEVLRGDLVKGFQIAEDQYVPFDRH